MSFLEGRSAVSICNRALSRIKQQPLQGSLDDPANLNKHAGRECLTWYNPIVREVLRSHHWGLAGKRVALVNATENNRSEEWTNAYLAPSDMAFPIMLGPYSSTGVVSYYKGVGYILAQLYGRPMFRYEGGLIYGNIDGAVLDYTSFNITEADFTDAVEKIIILSLAAQLARSVAKDDKLADEYEQKATEAMNLEIARNLNLGGPRYGEFMSEGEMARGGGYAPYWSGYSGYTR